MKILNYICNKYFNPSIFILFSILILSCNTEDDTPNFSDDTNFRLKSVSSYTSVNPDQKFTNFFQYDANNRLVKIQSNSLGSNLDFMYDDQSRLIQVGDYEYYYNNEGKVDKIKNENLIVASGKYDSTMVNYANGKISSFVESFTSEYTKRTNLTNISYNNREQIRLAVTTARTLYFESGQEYVSRKDKESYSYDSDGNLQKVDSELDYDSSNFLEIEKTYAFDNYNNPIQLLLKSTGIQENSSVIYLASFGNKYSSYLGGVFYYFKNNLVLYTSTPQTDDDGFVDYIFKTKYTYNKYGYPISAEETQTLVNQNEEYTIFTSWEYEEY